jgi:hypothetical protein
MTTPGTWDLVVSGAVGCATSSVVTQTGVVLAGEIKGGRAGDLAVAVVVATGLVALAWSVFPRLVDRLGRAGSGVVVLVGALGGGAFVGAVWWSWATSSPATVVLVVLAGLALTGVGAAAGRNGRPPPATPPPVPSERAGEDRKDHDEDHEDGRAAPAARGRSRRRVSVVLVVVASVAIVAAVTVVTTGTPGVPPDVTEREGNAKGTATTAASAADDCTKDTAKAAIGRALKEELAEVAIRFFDEYEGSERLCPHPEDFGPHEHGTPPTRTWDLRFTGPSGDTLLAGTFAGEIVPVPETSADQVIRQLDTQPVVQLSRVEVEGITLFVFGLPGGLCTAVYQYQGKDPFTFDPPSVALVVLVLMVTQGQWGEATEAVPAQGFRRQIDVTFKGKAGPDRRVTVGVTDADAVRVSGDFQTVRDATACPSGLTLESLVGASP